MMCDILGHGKVKKAKYREFCLKFLIMYEELLQTKMNISSRQEEIITDQFNQFVNILGDPKIDEDGEEFFDRDDYNEASKTNPKLVEWIENPQNYFNEMTIEMTKRSAKKEQKS